MYTVSAEDAEKIINIFRGESEVTREVISLEQYSVIDVSKGVALCSFNIDPTMQCQICADDISREDGLLRFRGHGSELNVKVAE